MLLCTMNGTGICALDAAHLWFANYLRGCLVLGAWGSAQLTHPTKGTTKAAVSKDSLVRALTHGTP